MPKQILNRDMNKVVILPLLALAVFGFLVLGSDVRLASAKASGLRGQGPIEERNGTQNSDTPARFPNLDIDPRTYQELRNQHLARLRGLGPKAGRKRAAALMEIDQREAALKQTAAQASMNRLAPEVIPTWTELGPRPLPNGETQQSGVTAPMTGRTTAVVVDPTDSNKVYLGTAQGGVWRSTDGGATWTAIFDTAQSLTIGAIALAPSSPSTLYVGTGEHAGGEVSDAFFGVGVYRIDNADTTATLAGPINPPYSFVSISNQQLTTTCFGGRAINKIVVHPTNPAIIYVATTGSFSGISGQTLGSDIPPMGLRGLYRSSNATADPASVTFQKLTVTTDGSYDSPGTGNTAIWDLVLEPGNPNNLLATVAGSSPPVGGVFRTTDALGANPVFTRVLTPTSNPAGLSMRLAINKIGSVVTVYVTSNETSSCPGEEGRVRKSIDAGVTWTDLPAADGFCGGLCIYSDPIAIDPNNANVIYLGGSKRGTCSDVLKKSSDGGVTFARDDTGLHSDAHAIFVDHPAAAPATVWVATDGGVWRRPDAAAGTAWSNKNNSPLGTLQFQSVAVHPTDRNFTIGGTQDNGTVAQQTTPGNWSGVESGDGGFALIDQSATNTTNVTMYHTFFNLSNVFIGFGRTNLGSCLATKNSWEFRGAGGGVDVTPSCDGTAKKAINGLNIADHVNFYAPMALGPGTPNTLYFGTDKLYRSTDRGDTMSVVSQNPLSSTAPVSAIGISRNNDNVRLVGMSDGKVFATVTGAGTLTDISPSLPDNPNGAPTPNLKYISRAIVDPNNPNVAYLTLSYYTPAGQGIFKTANLNLTGTGTVAWSAMGTGIPSIPINAFVIDPANSNRLFAGTDIGVYLSENGGTSWSPYGLGLPRVAVFDMAIQPTSRTLRVATHGRGMWEIMAPTMMISGTISYAIDNAKKVPNVTLKLTGNNNFPTQLVASDSNGSYAFSNLPGGIGNSYTLTLAKPSEANDSSITAFDASQAARFAANLISLSASQQIAADATNDGTVTAFDASRIARYQAQISTPGSIAGSWKFLPASLGFTNLSADQTNQNFQAILVGDVTGNWTPPAGPVPASGRAGTTATGSAASTVSNITVTLPTKQDPPGPTTIPITVGDTTGQGVGAYAFDISFNPSVLQPQVTPYDTTGTMSSGWTITANTATSGHLILNAFSTSDLTGQGTLLNLKFNVVGGAGAQTPLTWVHFTFNEGTPGDTDINGQFTVGAPTAASASISGQIVTSAGQPLSGTTVIVTGGARVLKTISDSEGRYRVEDAEVGRLYTVTPGRANYTFSPAERSFSLVGDRTDALFTGTTSGDTVNPLDTPEYFVRQQYLDVLGREPDAAGFNYWSEQLLSCNGDAECLRARRVSVASAFFIEQEFRQSGAYIYNVYESALGRRPGYGEYARDRRQVVGGATLEAQQQAFAEAFVARVEFVRRYESSPTAESFVTALLSNVQQTSGADLSSQREALIALYRTGTTQAESRGRVLREVAASDPVRAANYNAAFVLMEYFGYLQRNPDPGGYEFWLNVLNETGRDGDPGSYRGMVCSFITSTEYQRRFSAMVSHSNAECGP